MTKCDSGLGPSLNLSPSPGLGKQSTARSAQQPQTSRPAGRRGCIKGPGFPPRTLSGSSLVTLCSRSRPGTLHWTSHHSHMGMLSQGPGPIKAAFLSLRDTATPPQYLPHHLANMTRPGPSCRWSDAAPGPSSPFTYRPPGGTLFHRRAGDQGASEVGHLAFTRLPFTATATSACR